MKKTEIAERVAGEAGITKQSAQAAVGAVFDAIGPSAGVSFKAGKAVKDALK